MEIFFLFVSLKILCKFFADDIIQCFHSTNEGNIERQTHQIKTANAFPIMYRTLKLCSCSYLMPSSFDVD